MALFKKESIKPVSKKRFKIGVSLLVLTTLLSVLLIIDNAADMVLIIMPAIIFLVAISAPKKYVKNLVKDFYLLPLEPVLWLTTISSFAAYMFFLRINELIVAAIFYPIFVVLMFILGIEQTYKARKKR